MTLSLKYSTQLFKHNIFWISCLGLIVKMEKSESDHFSMLTNIHSQVNSANNTKFMTQLAIGLAIFGGTAYQLKQTVFVRDRCNSTPHHLMKNE